MIETKISLFKDWKSDKHTLVVFGYQGDSTFESAGFKVEDAFRAQSRADGFKAREGDSLLSRPAKSVPAERVIWLGLGKRDDVTSDTLRKAAARAVKACEALGLHDVTLLAPRLPKGNDALMDELHALAEGVYLGSYRFDRYKEKPSEKAATIEKFHLLLGDGATSDTLTIAKNAVARAKIYSRGTTIARDLINEPPSRMNPARLAEEAKKLNKLPVSVSVYETKDLERLGMGGILGVGSGGAVPPRLVELIYKPAHKAKKTVALVGKGITFDSGGLSLKPAQSMETMKDDMSGAAAVIGIFNALSELKPSDIEVRGYLAIAENMPGGRAQKPGDVLETFNGKTIEVLNTDAEGRLVLADALAYACSKKPDVVIDIATLTGACVVALGHLIAAVLSPDEKLSKAIQTAAQEAGERFWPLPLVKEYQPDIKSKIADVKNIGGRRGEAGTIIGGLFLQEFVKKDIAWAHLDIAGPSWTDSDGPLCPAGGTGHPVRTLLRWIERHV